MGRYISAAIFLFSLEGCDLSSNKAVPLSPDDYAQLDTPLPITWTPILTKTIDHRPVILGTILFDGTGNDRFHMSGELHETIEGHLYDKLNILKIPIFHYYAGAGTEPNKFRSLMDEARGDSVKDTAEKAAKKVISEITKFREQQPNADVRLLVSGFSRGAAAARHFMNIVEQHWDEQGKTGDSPTFYALIFDTVSTGQTKNLLLQVPVRADIFYHFVSEDERRIFFDLILDNPSNDGDGRVVTIKRPGVHSDIGASYNAGIGAEYVAYTNALLSGMGLIAPQCYEVAGDARSEGKNDSRWLIERAIGIGAPNTLNTPKYRNAKVVPISPMSENYRRQWKKRIFTLQFEGNLSNIVCVKENHLDILRFIVKHSQNKFEIFSRPPFLLPTVKIQHNDMGYLLTYYADGVTQSRIGIPVDLLDSIPEGHSIHLDLGIVIDKNNRAHFWWFVNNVRMQEVDEQFYVKH
ncbi:DUF2235 domain-containing protein [Komagataeibacter saccharivorans]|uniref:DUF2235 domain-containing protein n=1 Tax=Komagataeibacter saccharivorans TaxID=265959 RepID=UPI0022313A2F|nr:DUF2235 domain-containing protein [Komagataeibacter saccharivorans]